MKGIEISMLCWPWIIKFPPRPSSRGVSRFAPIFPHRCGTMRATPWQGAMLIQWLTYVPTQGKIPYMLLPLLRTVRPFGGAADKLSIALSLVNSLGGGMVLLWIYHCVRINITVENLMLAMSPKAAIRCGLGTNRFPTYGEYHCFLGLYLAGHRII